MRKRMNLELKAAIIGKFGTQYAFAATMRTRESLISAVVCGRTALDEASQIKWARVLGVEDYKQLFKWRVEG